MTTDFHAFVTKLYGLSCAAINVWVEHRDYKGVLPLAQKFLELIKASEGLGSEYSLSSHIEASNFRNLLHLVFAEAHLGTEDREFYGDPRRCSAGRLHRAAWSAYAVILLFGSGSKERGVREAALAVCAGLNVAAGHTIREEGARVEKKGPLLLLPRPRPKERFSRPDLRLVPPSR
ncbi:MAG TPA: hypothetical protein VJI74_03415 [Candidatus Paceibacterota bacterium]